MPLLLTLNMFHTFWSVSIVALSVYFSKGKCCLRTAMEDFRATSTEVVNTEAYRAPLRIFKKDLFVKIFNCCRCLTLLY